MKGFFLTLLLMLQLFPVSSGARPLAPAAKKAIPQLSSAQLQSSCDAELPASHIFGFQQSLTPYKLRSQRLSGDAPASIELAAVCRKTSLLISYRRFTPAGITKLLLFPKHHFW